MCISKNAQWYDQEKAGFFFSICPAPALTGKIKIPGAWTTKITPIYRGQIYRVLLKTSA